MSSVFLAWLAVVVCSLGSREQRLIAALTEKGSAASALVGMGLIANIASATAMAFAGHSVAGMLPQAAQTMLVAFALFAAAIELAMPVRAVAPREPTRSLVALFVVLVYRQFGDAGRFLMFAIAAAGSSPALAAVGGVVGGFCSTVLAVMAASEMRHWPLAWIRRWLAFAAAAAGIYFALLARGAI